MLLIFHSCDDVTSWRHVMTSLNLIYLYQLVDVLESWFFLFSWSFRSQSSKMLLIFQLCDALTSWRHVITSCHDVTKPDLPISACRCARKLILFLFPWFFRSMSSKMLMFFNYFDVLVSWRHVMTSCHDVTKTVSLISGYGFARKMILFMIPWFFWLFILKMLVFM